MGVVGEAVEDGAGGHVVREDAHPVAHRAVAGHDDGARAVSHVDDLVKPFA